MKQVILKLFVCCLVFAFLSSPVVGEDSKMGGVIVTLHIFSGNPDPVWELTENQVIQFEKNIAVLKMTTLIKPPGLMGGLGYRGFSIDAPRNNKNLDQLYIHSRIVGRDNFSLNLVVPDVALELWLLNTGKNVLSEDVFSYVEGVLIPDKKNITPKALFNTPSLENESFKDFIILSVPPYDPGRWNDNPNIRRTNNCYNYCNDLITNTFAQPGRGTGRTLESLECQNVGDAAVRDGLKRVDGASATPAEGHFVALVIWPGRDYHWYRLDSSAFWSHKPGQTNVRDWDNSGNKILDPKSCDRGPYSIFCGYFHTIPSQVRIR